MRTRLTLRRENGTRDVVVTADATATVADVAETLFAADPDHRGAGAPGPLTLHVASPGDSGRTLDPAAPIVEAGVRSGATATVVVHSDAFSDASASRGPAAALVRVIAGPDAGREFSIPSGASVVGRGAEADVRLNDPLVSKRHARLNVAASLEVVDLRSANGVVVGGRRVTREPLSSGEPVTLGNTELAVIQLARSAEPAAADIGVTRSPRVVPPVAELELTAPEPPKALERQRFPWIAVIAPMLMGVGVLVMSPGLQGLMFMALGPLLGVASWVDQTITSRRTRRIGSERFAEALTDLERQLTEAQEREREARHAAFPGLSDCLDAGLRVGPMLWTRRPEHEEFGRLRLGTGSVPSASTVKMPGANDTDVSHWRALQEVVSAHAEISEVPVTVALADSGALGVVGPAAARDGFGRALVAQLVVLHSPSELVLCALTSAASRPAWEWLTWLPHVSSPHSPLTGEHLAADAAAAGGLLLRLEELVSERGADGGEGGRGPLPLVMVLVSDDAPADRGRLTRLAEQGPAVGVHLVWLADALGRVPAGCRTYVALTDDTPLDAEVGSVPPGRVDQVRVESLPVADAEHLARVLAPLVDAGAPVDDDSGLPRAVSYLSLAGRDLVSGPEAVVDRWRQTGSLSGAGSGAGAAGAGAAGAVTDGPEALPARSDPTLRALVGQAGMDPLYLDLRTQGPHALVGGTTGAGKSEFLQSWILGMASAYSPQRVTFLFVDYKGGAAFAECVKLPHYVGLVTDLSPHLVRRALTSLRAELRYREHILNDAKAKDLISMEKERHPDTPPALVIVVDEFAALVQEVPEFVDGVVDVAQRGRSLGLHLILATQRPAGVIKDNLRANTNLRVALRMADEDDSTDILGLPIAAQIDPSIPGRGAVKTGPGRITAFQTGYAGARTSDTPPPPRIDVAELGFGSPVPWDVPERGKDRREVRVPTDIARIVDTVAAASASVSLEPPRRPWLDELAVAYDVSKLRQRTDAELVLGVVDDPDHQRQGAGYWRPDVDGNLGIYGGGGSGKSAAMRTIAVAAAITPRGGPVHVYGLDFGSRGLAMIEQLPHVGAVISGDDGERVARLLRWLRSVVNERAERYASAAVSSIDEYRRASGRRDEPRIVLLVDGMAAFREQYDTGANAALFVMFEQIAADGRGVGVHMVVSADRASAVPPSIRSTLQRRLVLRLADENEYGMLDVPADVLKASSPPGRGILDDLEIQVAVMGGSASSARQSAAIAALARSMPDSAAAPGIERMPEEVTLASLPAGGRERLVLGVEEQTLGPWGVAPEGTFLVTGPPGSGRTSALMTWAAALHRDVPGVRLCHIGPDRSPLRGQGVWSAAVPASRAEELLGQLEDAASGGIGGGAGPGGGPLLALIVEDLPGMIGSLAETAMESCVAALIEHGHLVVAEGEMSRLNQYGPVLQTFKGARRGMILQPDAGDGDSVFRTDFPRSTRADFPPGRGFVTEKGKVWRLQLAMP